MKSFGPEPQVIFKGSELKRRDFVTGAACLLAQYLIAPSLGLASQLTSNAPGRNSSAFDARNPESVYAALGIPAPEESRNILISAPDVAENGANVPIEVMVKLPLVERILIIGEHNLFPLLADASFNRQLEPWFETRVKLAETSRLRVIVQSDGKLYTASRAVKVIIGGCLPG